VRGIRWWAVKSAFLIVLVLAALAAPAAQAAQPRTTLPDVEDEVMCVECGTALNVSTSPVAERERVFIRRRIAEGKSKAEIKAALMAEYGPRVLATPEGGGFDVAAWLVPGGLCLLALLGIGVVALRWRGKPAAAEPDTGPELDPDDARRLDADLASFDR
jgi:cytochrome c-type biogenesis protein CcmH